MDEIRPNGFYWVKRNGEWQPAEWAAYHEGEKDAWWLLGFDWQLSDSDLEAIGPREYVPELP